LLVLCEYVGECTLYIQIIRNRVYELVKEYSKGNFILSNKRLPHLWKKLRHILFLNQITIEKYVLIIILLWISYIMWEKRPNTKYPEY